MRGIFGGLTLGLAGLAAGCGGTVHHGAMAVLVEHERMAGHPLRGGTCSGAASPKEWECIATRTDGTTVRAVVTLGATPSISYNATAKRPSVPPKIFVPVRSP